jgi:glycosyltransferase involved in cell wall biosynthesis
MVGRSCELSVVIPAFNEGERIARTLKETSSCLKAYFRSFEIIIVDDGSRDKTAAAAKAAIKSLRLGDRAHVISYPVNQGKGWALRQGTLAARGECIAFFDADLDIAPQHIVDYYCVLQREDADAVVASKRHPESQLTYARSRVIISNIYYWFNRIFFRLNIKDTQTGMKVFRRQILLAVLPRLLGKRFAFDLELLVNIRRLGGEINSQPVTITGHETFGRIRFISLWHAFVDTLAIFYRVYVLRYYNWRVLPKLPDAGVQEDACSLAICIFSRGYGRRLEDVFAHLRDICGFTNPIIILAPRADFTLRDAQIVARAGMSKGEALLAAAERTSCGAIVCLDEHSRPTPNWISHLASYMALRNVDAVTGPLGEENRPSSASRFSMRVLQHFLLPFFPFSRYNQIRQRWCSRAELVNLCVRTRVLRNETEAHAFSTTDEHPYQIYCERLYAHERSILYSPDCILAHNVRPFGLSAGRELYHAAKRRGHRQIEHPEHFVRIRDYSPAFFLIVLTIGCVFSFFSEIFWQYWRWAIIIWLALAYVGSGHFLKAHKALFVSLGVFLGNVLCGLGFIGGLFISPRTRLEDE